VDFDSRSWVLKGFRASSVKKEKAGLGRGESDRQIQL
jgi:hypothetical protein